MINFLCKIIMYICTKTGRVININGTEDVENVYMVRYIIARNKYFSIYIHQFLRSDRDDLHNHPWWFYTYLVKGEYKEVFLLNNKVNSSIDPNFKTIVNIRNIKQNRFVFRNSDCFHRVEVSKRYTLAEKESAPLTIFFSGPRKQEWGFLTPKGFIPWKKYLNLPETEPER